MMAKGRQPTVGANGTYEVGYKKPPAEHRFRKGKSGNPKGRPKGARNKPQPLAPNHLENLILEEAYREVRVPDGDRILTMPVAQVALRSMAAKAAKGDHRSQRLLAELVSAVETKRYADEIRRIEVAIEYKMEWTEELRYREGAGLPPPDPMPLPHPDDVSIDTLTGQIEIRGPSCQADVEVQERTAAHVENMLDEIEQLATMAEGAETDQDREAYLQLRKQEQQQLKRFLAKMVRFGERWPRHWPPVHLRDRLPHP